MISAWVATRPAHLYLTDRRDAAIRAVLAAGYRGDETEREAATSPVGQFAGLNIDLRDTDPDYGADKF